MNNEELLDAVQGLVERGTFAVLAVRTAEGEVALRPIGGRWDPRIVDAVREMAGKYPGCKMRLLEQSYDWERYFEGIVDREQVLPYSEYSPETKAALAELRQQVLGSSGKKS